MIVLQTKPSLDYLIGVDNETITKELHRAGYIPYGRFGRVVYFVKEKNILDLIDRLKKEEV